MSDDPVLAALATILNRLGHIETRLDGLETRLDRLEDGQTRLRVDLMARLERLEDKVTAIQDDILVNMSRADRAHDAAEGARGDMRGLSAELAVLWRQVRRQGEEIREIRGEKH